MAELLDAAEARAREAEQEIEQLKNEIKHLRDTRNLEPSQDYLIACLVADRDALRQRLNVNVARVQELERELAVTKRSKSQ
jgi:predicted RNase H-like nuclease (RuvC/YqgF family)